MSVEPTGRSVAAPAAGIDAGIDAGAPAGAPVAAPTPLQYRGDIDGLRAVAVGLVVLYHAGVGALAGGYVGVDVFFVISGFLITTALVGQGESGRVRLLAFYAGRMRRLLPLSTLTLVVTCGFGFWLLPAARFDELLGDARSALLYVANWRFADKSIAYVDTEVADGMLTHFWSLSIEEQYYFGWPLLIALGVLARRRMPRASLRLIVGVMAACVIAVSLGMSIVLTPDGGSRAYYLTHLRLWEIAAGALVAVTVHRWRVPARAATAVRVCAVGAIVVAALRYDELTSFPGHAALVPVIATVLLVGLGGRGGAADRALGWSPMRYVGERSYALYLWHWPALGITDLVVERRGLGWSHWPQVAVALTAAALLSIVTHALVENPVRFSPRLKRMTAGTLAVGIASTLLLVVAIAPVRDRKFALADQEWANAPMTPSQASEDTVTALYRRCHQSLAADFKQLRWCELGDREGSVTVLLVGDSHAQHWAPAIDAAGAANGWRVLLTTRSACMPYDVTLFSGRLERIDGPCNEWGDAVRADIAAQEQVDLLVVARARAYIEAVRADDGAEVEPAEAERLVSEAVAGLVNEVAGPVDRLVVFQDTAWTGRRIPDCLDETGRALAAQCDFPVVLIPEEQRLIAAERAGFEAAPAVPAESVPVTEIACPGGVCRALTADGLITFRDGSHLTASYSRSLADDIATVIADALAG